MPLQIAKPSRLRHTNLFASLLLVCAVFVCALDLADYLAQRGGGQVAVGKGARLCGGHCDSTCATSLINGSLGDTDTCDECRRRRRCSQSAAGANSFAQLEASARKLVRNVALINQVQAIRIVRLDAPKTSLAGEPIKLRCLYEATRGDRLQSLSWYKNGREFYRYQPAERRQPILVFNVTGVQVDLARSRNSTVNLTNTTSETSGRYRCEATGTSFNEVNLEAHVEVLPVPAQRSRATRGPTGNSWRSLGLACASALCASIVIASLLENKR